MSMASKIAIFGAGGHGITVLDALLESGWGAQSIVFLDDGGVKERFSIPVVGDRLRLSDVDFLAGHDIIIGIGDTRIRYELSKVAQAYGARFASAIHPLANISRMALVGQGTYIAPFANIGAHATVGDFCVINTGAMVGHDCAVLDGASVNDGTVLGGGVKVGQEAYIGTNVSVLPRLTIGPRAIVGAGAVVTRTVRATITVKGVPAK